MLCIFFFVISLLFSFFFVLLFLIKNLATTITTVINFILFLLYLFIYLFIPTDAHNVTLNGRAGEMKHIYKVSKELRLEVTECMVKKHTERIKQKKKLNNL